MPLTIASLLRQSGLELTALGNADLTRPLTWVYASDLPDPTRWLDGGELILTSGLWLRAHQSSPDAYVRRLVGAGAAGVGFAVGKPTPELQSYRRVPAGIVSAADRHALPILELPPETTFIAVSKAVSNALSADAHAAVVKAYEAQRRLVRIAVQPDGAHRLARELSKRLDAWVLVVDGRGEPIAAAPHDALGRAERVVAAINRLARSSRADVFSMSAADEHVVGYRLRTGTRARGLLAVGSPARLSVERQHVANVAAALLSLLLEPASSAEALEQRARARIAHALLRGETGLATELAAVLDIVLPHGNVVVAAVTANGRRRDRFWQELAAAVEPVLAALDPCGLVALLPADDVGALRGLLAQAHRVPDLAVGLSDVVTDAAVGRRQALAAADQATRTGTSPVHFCRLSHRPLLDAIPTDAGRQFSEAVLAPLVAYDAARGTELVPTLRTWLSHHGQWDPAAAELGVHRHTLRGRIERIERLTRRSLGDATARMEFWAALELAG